MVEHLLDSDQFICSRATCEVCVWTPVVQYQTLIQGEAPEGSIQGGQNTIHHLSQVLRRAKDEAQSRARVPGSP